MRRGGSCRLWVRQVAEQAASCFHLDATTSVTLHCPPNSPPPFPPRHATPIPQMLHILRSMVVLKGYDHIMLDGSVPQGVSGVAARQLGVGLVARLHLPSCGQICSAWPPLRVHLPPTLRSPPARRTGRRCATGSTAR